MSRGPHQLEYARRERWYLPAWVYLFLLFLWPTTAAGMWICAVLGPALVVLEIVDCFHPLGLNFPKPVWKLIVTHSAFSVVAISFTLWHVRWRSRLVRKLADRPNQNPSAPSSAP